jgi:hypothetical protein
MTETETEHERKVREYWARAYDDLIKSKDKDSSSNKSLIKISVMNWLWTLACDITSIL